MGTENIMGFIPISVGLFLQAQVVIVWGCFFFLAAKFSITKAQR